jgi:hypothetical protein
MKTAHTIGSEYGMCITFAQTILQIIEIVKQLQNYNIVKSMLLYFVDYVYAVM